MLVELAERGFDLHRPRSLLQKEILQKSSASGGLVSLVYVGEFAPDIDWYVTKAADEPSFCRISNKLLTSVIFTGIMSPDWDWAHCIVCFADVAPLFATGTRIFLEPPPTLLDETTGAGRFYDPHDGPEMINVVVGWMYHNDVYLLLSDF